MTFWANIIIFSPGKLYLLWIATQKSKQAELKNIYLSFCLFTKLSVDIQGRQNILV